METLKRWSSIFFSCTVICPKTKVLEEKQLDDQTEIYFPTEIMEDIISRLPVKSILRFRTVSKPWLSLISNPSFTKLQLTRATLNSHTAFIIIAFNKTTHERHLLSAPSDGGRVTHLMTLKPFDRSLLYTKTLHLNGIVCCIFNNGYMFHNDCIFVVNPSTREILELRVFQPEKVGYFLGFDETRNEHKILGIANERLSTNATNQIRIFSMSNHSWRKIDATIDDSSSIGWFKIISSVCVNSIMHFLVEEVPQILAFDLRTEKFFAIKLPDNAASSKYAYLLTINESVGLVSHHRVVEICTMHLWWLQDYENHVWVKEPFEPIYVDEIVVSVRKLSRNVISAYIYSINSRSYRSIQFTLNHPLLRSNAMEFNNINRYVESIMPLSLLKK